MKILHQGKIYLKHRIRVHSHFQQIQDTSSIPNLAADLSQTSNIFYEGSAEQLALKTLEDYKCNLDGYIDGLIQRSGRNADPKMLASVLIDDLYNKLKDLKLNEVAYRQFYCKLINQLFLAMQSANPQNFNIDDQFGNRLNSDPRRVIN